jgi:hypothetical protein
MAAKFRRSVARGLATKGKFKKKPAKAGSTSWARLSIFNKGVVWGMHVAGLKRSDMAAHVQKTDGSKPHLVNGQRTCAVNVQSTYSQRTVNIQSTYSQHTVNMTIFHGFASGNFKLCVVGVQQSLFLLNIKKQLLFAV